MYKKIISIFFTVLFLAFLSAPTIITMVNDSVDISAFYSMSEEEEGHNAKKFLNSDNFSEIDISYVEEKSKQAYTSKKYPRPLINLVSPPPDFYIL
ncbi:MAG: hypothetical protein ACSHW4_07730 [Cellulophaga sp.]|uniref:hypothetical protein n=2 Tax=Cellulophaga TaxID=104264 RepID=UPI000C2BC847|nr:MULTISPECIES: hypothetical protein [unclassified Cellulophaga]MDO6491252.1 hypothetical protein [Cellulophaga sp. 2_MG-2023]MDO6495215.1 hypothetical protein [Cellulophaga sp. 3_MG-2023]PKB42791.1 hypothetical protein AX016_0962 [Cellulophaga sp. RHA19]